MSRIGKKPVPIPDGVKVALQGRTVEISGPVGKLKWEFRPEVSVRVDEAAKVVLVDRQDDSRTAKTLHGLTRNLIANMVEGCCKGYSRALEVFGVGYGVNLQGDKFSVVCGRSHPVVFQVPAGIKVEVTTPQARGETEPARFKISGADKQAVGEFAARVRKSRPPEPYKGKGVRYVGEHVRRKVGKAFAGGATG